MSGIERWDLVCHTKAWGKIVDAEASILVNCFKAIDHNREFVWEKWSKDNPELAKKLWPSIQKLAIHRAYFAIPELLQFAATCPSVEKLQKTVDEISRLAASDQVARLAAKREFSEARITLEWGKTFGSSPEFDRLDVLIRNGLISHTDPKK